MANHLYYGDNLDVMRRYIGDESVDLVYLDPPFNSDATYNVLFAEAGNEGQKAAAQIKAFEDTWRWDQTARKAYDETVDDGGPVSNAMQAFFKLLGPSNMMAYIAMMAPRLVELRRVMKPTASIYLHCDPTASHYLKLLMDAVFGPENFRNEIVWKRTTAHSNVYNCYGDITDSIFFYSKGAKSFWQQGYKPIDTNELTKLFPNVDPDGRRWRSENMRNPGVRPNLKYSYTASNGVTYEPHPNGWTVSIEKMRQFDKESRLHFPTKKDGRLRLKFYEDEWAGIKLQNLWEDIPPIGAQAAERMGYPTQKPIALLERIISTSCPDKGIVLDPFCGCGTAVVAAQKLNRSWIGIDITHLAIALIKSRLKDSFGSIASYKVLGEPVSVPDAQTLADSDPYQFQWWALGLVGARPEAKKKGSDRGIDGRLFFKDEAEGGKLKQVVLSIKGGHNIGSLAVRDLRAVIEREKAEIGVLITMQEPTKPMRTEAVEAGLYQSPGAGTSHPRLQILTITELLAGRRIDLPFWGMGNVTLKKAPKLGITEGEQAALGL